MTVFLDYTVLGIVIGCIYALTSTGLVVTYTTTGIFNFAHGAIGMISAYTYWQFSIGWGWPQPIALVVVLFGIAPLFGIIIERGLMRPLYGAPVDVTVVVTLGLLLSLIGLATLLWNPQQIRELPKFFGNRTVSLFGYNVDYHSVVVVVVAITVAMLLRLFFQRTRTGIAMRAVVDNPDLVALAGGPPVRIQQLSWAMGCSLAALAGILLAPIRHLTILQLTLLVISGYAAAVVGRLKSLPMTVVGALALGLMTEYVAWGGSYLTGHPSTVVNEYVLIIMPQIMLFIALLFIPAAKLRVGSIVGPRAPQPASLRSSLVWGVLLVAATAAISPLLSAADLISLSRGMALALVLLSLVLLTGYTGLTSLCQMTFVGLGAFAMGKWATHGQLWGLLPAIGLAAVVGLVIGALTLRLRGLYLALATFAVAAAADEIFFTRRLGTGGSLPVARPHVPGIPRSDKAYFIELAVVFAVAGIGVLAIRRGRYGRRLSALDDSPAACATLGLNVNWTKIAVFTTAAGLAGLGGALYGAVPGQVSNNDFIVLLSLVILLQLRVGGVNTVTGAFLGAMFFALFGVFTNHDVKIDMGHTFHLGDLQYLLTGVAAIAVSRDPGGVGARIADLAEQIRDRWANHRFGGSRTRHPSESGVPESELAHV